MITQFGGIVPLTLYLSGDAGESVEVGDSTPTNTIIMAVILIFSAIQAYRHRDDIVRAIPGMIPVLCFLALALLSALWSDYPAITVRRTGTAVTTALWGAYLASRFSLRDVVVLVAQAIGIIAVLSLIAAVLFPDFGVNELLESDPDGIPGWRGMLDGKNTLGIVMTTGTITMLYLIISPGASRRQKAILSLGLVLCVAELHLSQSRTSWLAGMIGVITCLAVRAAYRRPAAGIVALCWMLLLGLPAIMLVISDLSVLTSLVGKDATLTGRVDLWAVVLPYGNKRPLLGYGYGAFWIADSPMTQEIWRVLNSYKPPHAHNGWIETYLELGWAGCLVVAMQLMQMVVSAARASNQGRDIDAPYMLMIVVMMLIFNMVEADLIRAPALFWPFLTFGPVAIAKVMRKPQHIAAADADLRVASRARPVPPPLPARLNLTAPPPLKRPPYPPLRPSPQTGR